jgi:hypothetical protein
MRMSKKNWQRQQLEILVNEAETLDDLRVCYLPSHRTIRCSHCGHSGRACIPHQTRSPRFKCSQCGRRN